MPRLTAGSVQVFTHKDGLLSRVAHDLQIQVTRWSVSVAGDAVEATVDPASLQVVGAVEAGRLAPGTLSARDRRTIDDTLRKEILEAQRHPTLRWVGRQVRAGERLRLEGVLHLKGARQPADLVGALEGGALVARATLTPSRWGIAPYRALLGALKLQDRVEVVVRIEGWPEGV